MAKSNNSEKLTSEEKKLLKEEIKKVWDEFPIEMKRFLIEVKKERLKAFYMIEGWARDNHHQQILELISRRIAAKEEKIKGMEESLKGK